MAATAAYSTEVYITASDTNPTSSDLMTLTTSVGYNRSYAEIDISSIGESFTNLIQGQESTEVSFSLVWDPNDTAQGRIKTAFDGRSNIWVHVALTGTTACDKVKCLVTAMNWSLEPGGAVTAEVTIRSVGARSTSTVS